MHPKNTEFGQYKIYIFDPKITITIIIICRNANTENVSLSHVLYLVLFVICCCCCVCVGNNFINFLLLYLSRHPVSMAH